MPPSRSHTNNPQGRQKSCSQCAKGKRKCGLEQPSCARCARQQITCIYPSQPSRRPLVPQHHTTNSQDDFATPEISIDFQDILTTDDSFNFNVVDSTSSGPDLLDFDLSVGANSLDSLSEMLFTPSTGDDQIALREPFYTVAKPFSQAHIAPFAKSRIEYSIEQLKLIPKMMVEQNCTPWAHATLYEEFMPRPLQDAHAACALYITKNSNNTEQVTRFITGRAEELALLAMPTAPIEVLARAHALLLYQIMLVFSGDMRMYGQAEEFIFRLEEVGNSLLAIAAEQTDTAGTLPLYPGAVARSAWKSYILRESIRRTLLSVFQFASVCNLLRGQLKSCLDSLACGNRITLSAHLWNVKSAFDFAVAWNEKKHFLVKELDFTEVLREAKPDDMDVFARMILVGLQGIDDVRGWFYTRGGIL